MIVFDWSVLRERKLTAHQCNHIIARVNYGGACIVLRGCFSSDRRKVHLQPTATSTMEWLRSKRIHVSIQSLDLNPSRAERTDWINQLLK